MRWPNLKTQAGRYLGRYVLVQEQQFVRSQEQRQDRHRYFFKAMPSDPDRARIALGHMGTLFRVEGSMASSPRKRKRLVRQEQSKPTVDAFFA